MARLRHFNHQAMRPKETNERRPEPYSTLLSKGATRTMRKLPENIRSTVEAKLSALAADPIAANNNVRPLRGVPGYRLRIGDWRVLYEVDHQQGLLRVRHIGPRGEDYKP